jgi:hypothetical protein
MRPKPYRRLNTEKAKSHRRKLLKSKEINKLDRKLSIRERKYNQILKDLRKDLEEIGFKNIEFTMTAEIDLLKWEDWEEIQ